MTDQAWQYLVVLLCVAGAGLYVARQMWRTFAPRKAAQSDGTCDSCSGCASASDVSQKPMVNNGFVSLDALRDRTPGEPGGVSPRMRRQKSDGTT